MIQKINSIKNTVFDLLTKDVRTRDSDRLLILRVWSTQNPSLRNADYSFQTFAMDFKAGDYVDPESIRRARQKIQEQHEGLQGTVYKQRKGEEKIMRNEINKMKTGNLFQFIVSIQNGLHN